jgi:hypothetical protein
LCETAEWRLESQEQQSEVGFVCTEVQAAAALAVKYRACNNLCVAETK